MDTYKTKSGIIQPHKKNRIAVKVTEEFKLTEEPAGEIDFSNHHCIYRERLKTALASCKKPHIDEGMQGNETLLESLRLASVLTNKSPNPIVGINSDTSIAYVNTALEELTGYSSDELIGIKTPYPWWTKSSLEKIRRNFEKTLNNDINKVEELFTKKNGELFWVEITSTIIKNEERLQYCLSNWVDITERKQDKEALKETTFNLKERLKELNCFHEISLLKDVPNKTLNEFLQDVASLIPPVGQHPELTCARITFEGNEFKTDNFKKTKHKLNADIKVAGKAAGVIEVCYLGRDWENDKDPFLEGESKLADTIAREIGKYTTRVRAEEALKDTTFNLKERLKELNCFHEVSLLKDVPNKTLNEFLQDVASLLPPVGQHPELICARIIFEGNEFVSDNFKKSSFKLTSNIRVAGKSAGTVEVFCNDQKIKYKENPFLEEEKTLVDAIARETGKHITRIRAEERLLNTHERLITDQVTLKRKNIALKEVLNQIEYEKKQSASFIQSNINKILMPILRKLQDKADPDEKHYILLLQNSLEEIVSPFINKLESKYSELLPREVQICNMIKNGMTTKEIASNLEISIETIRSQRKNIRKKLGIANKKVPLTAFLNQS